MKTQLNQLIDLDSLPVAPSSELTEKEEQLIARFEDLDLQAIERLTEGGKRLVEWGTAAVGIFFAALALLSNPTVLATFAQPTAKLIGAAAVVGYLLAIICGFFSSIPKRYKRRIYGLKEMERQLETVSAEKNRLVVLGSLAFMIGTIALGALILMVLLSL